MTSKKKFDGMSPAQQRVAIAKDAMAWIEEGALRPTHGRYVEPDDQNSWYDAPRDSQLRDVNLGKCDVCAIGAMFLAKAVRFNAVTCDDLADSAYHERLLDHFSEYQLALIETAFEGGSCSPFDLSMRDKNKAVTFHRQFDAPGGVWDPNHARKVLTAILENIISNDGTFVP